MKKVRCNIKMSLIAKGINVQKVCKNTFEVYQFERDMPCKYGLLNSSTPYVIGKLNLDSI